RTANKTEAAKAGENLYKQTKSDLEQIKSILGTDNLSYSNVADKVANEILQCSIDYFNDSQEKDADNNYHAHATKLVKLAQSIAVGGVVKGRSKENLDTLEGMKDREINNAIHILQLIKKVYDDVRYDFHRSVNTDKINEMLQDVFTNKNCRKIESCQNYFLLNEYITLLNSIINKSSNYYWLKTHCNTVITLKNQIIIQQILFIAKSRTDKDGVAYIIEILKEAAKYDLSVINELITKEITDTIIEKIALNNNQTLIKEFYDIAIKNHTLQLRVEKIFAEKLPNSSALKSQILRQIETRKKQEEERKEKNRIASLWYNNPKRWSDFSDWIPEGCLSAGILSLPIIPIFAILVIIYGIYRLMAVIARSINS
ncbi:MAG: hypothetical protein LBQ01_02000, partial [Prevotellaceae bacterium]|nr:hypothetical protein [Prevotellaceae bacterium]